eukprot:CAMPEP_0182437798 /NCGR_PEP_ID=MMETSP1167-20130531/85292_1 /TAXON_ID=2988 /ORGANISM="Mallomonas Sp, Strain CCMP3275" /LENGTH=159 /DNA_ID=CAMNT_0024630847 /DNA_START=591 /DNA_END=1067 /DNA_ORIENTATION=-
MYISTLPRGARGCRTWVALVMIAMLLGEIFFCLTETTLPSFMPPSLTEFEFASMMHAVFPCLLLSLRCLSEYWYIDIDKVTVETLGQITKHNKAMHGLLHQLQVMVTPEEKTQCLASLDEIKAKISELRDVMKESNQNTVDTISLMKDANANPGSNYYW